MDIILASTSPYRKALLDRLQIDYQALPPEVDEKPLSGEAPGTLAQRLARDKALAIAAMHPDALVIGSDQVASLDGSIIGKPGTPETARKQLLDASGQEILFLTAVALISLTRKLEHVHIERTAVRFRKLSKQRVDNYLAREEPWDCAGSFKVESLGIALFESIDGHDPTALEGLPLIALTAMLDDAGVDVLQG